MNKVAAAATLKRQTFSEMSTKRHTKHWWGILIVWGDIFRCTRLSLGSPVTSDKQVGNLVLQRHKKNHMNPQWARRLQAQNGLSTSFPNKDFSMSHTQSFLCLFCSAFTTSLCHTADLVTHTHPYTQTRTNSMHITLHYPSVGWLGALSGQREWVVTLVVLHHSFSLLSNQVSSNNKSNTTVLYHPCSCNTMFKVFYVYLYIYLLKSHSSLSPSCSTAVQSLGGIWCSQWGFCWTMEKQLWQGSGRCEVFSSSQSSKDEFERSEAWKNMVKWLNQSQNSDWKESLDAGGLPLAFTEAAVKRESVVTFLAHRYYTTVI